MKSDSRFHWQQNTVISTLNKSAFYVGDGEGSLLPLILS